MGLFHDNLTAVTFTAQSLSQKFILSTFVARYDKIKTFLDPWALSVLRHGIMQDRYSNLSNTIETVFVKYTT